MDINDLLKLGAAAFKKSQMSGNTGSKLDVDILTTALSGLTGGNNSNGSFDIGALLGKMQNGGMTEVVQSWLGNGNNAEISDNNVNDIFDNDQISDFASQLGLSKEEAVGGLRDALPQMVDKASSNGSLLDSIGGISGAINIASKIFAR